MGVNPYGGGGSSPPLNNRYQIYAHVYNIIKQTSIFFKCKDTFFFFFFVIQDLSSPRKFGNPENGYLL